MSDEPRAHVLRPPLPWRPADRTECGKPTADYALIWTRDELLDHVKRHGKQRTAFLVCMTCMSTAGQWKDWAESPIDVVAREFYGGRRDERWNDELRAIAALIEAHREEFGGYMQGLTEVVSLADVRQARRLAAARRPGGLR